MLVRGLAWRKVVSSVFLYVIGFLGEFGLSPFKIALTLRKFFHSGGVSRGGLGLDHQRGLRRESGLKRRDFLCSELKQNIEKWDDLFLRGRTHLGLPVVVSGQGRLPATVMGGSQIVMPAK